MILQSVCPLTIPDALDRAVAVGPDVEAIVASDGRLTFAELDREVSRLIVALCAKGIRPGDRIAICMGNSARWVSLFLALGSIGAVTVPINTRFVADEIGYALRQSRVKGLFIVDRFLQIDFVSMLRSICPGIDASLPDPNLPDLQFVVVIGKNVPKGATSFVEFFAASAEHHVPAKCTGDDVLLIQYTSGTTSFPKGVMLTQASMLANAFFSGSRMGLRVGDRFHSARPFFHVAGTTLSILSSLQHVVTLVTMDRFEPKAALDLLEYERCTHLSGNDTMALMLLNHPDRDASKLTLRGAWAAASPTVMRRIIDELGARECVSGYGLSEASPNVAQSCWWEPEEIRVSSRMRVQPGVEVAILDGDGRQCPTDEVGEIFVRGWNVMRGYFDRPDETMKTLSDDGWLRTGDLGCVGADGRLAFVGRAKDIIRVGGENVSPAEIEDILHRHPSIRQAAVVGVPDERLVEVVALFVILKEGHQESPESIAAWCGARMAGFKVPRRVWVVDDFESIGMTASAKVQRKALAAHALNLMKQHIGA